MLAIRYYSETRTARLTAEQPISDLHWAEIRRVCVSPKARGAETGHREIVLPWWGLLAARADLVQVLQKNGVGLHLDDASRELIRQALARIQALRTPLEIDPNDLPERLRNLGFLRGLTPEQLRNVSILARFPAAATFSVPGAGKTTEALAFYTLKRDPDCRLMVVCPKNAFTAWEEQVERCLGAGISVVRLRGGRDAIEAALAGSPDIALITYQQLSRVIQEVGGYLAGRPAFMFLDESHRMKKGLQGVHGSSILSIAHLPISRLVLSGTPMPNSTADLVPQFNYLYPETPVTAENVVDRIRRIYVRTRKDELGLRDPDRLLVPVRLGLAQQRLYRVLSSETARLLEGLSLRDRARMRAFGASVMRLIQALVEPALLSQSSIADHEILRDAIGEGPSTRIQEVCRLTRNLARDGHKVIIWSQFVSAVETMADLLSDLGADYIHGGVETDEDDSNQDSREAKIARFHTDPNCMVMVANPAACSEGISLHEVCHHAIYLDRSYNAAQYLQSEDRIHRLGLAREQRTTVLLMHAEGTIDDSISRRLESKVQRMGQVLNDANLNIEPAESDDDLGLDEEDLADLRRVLRGGAA